MAGALSACEMNAAESYRKTEARTHRSKAAARDESFVEPHGGTVVRYAEMTTSYNKIAGQSVERLAALSDGIFAVAMTPSVSGSRILNLECWQMTG